MRTIIAITVILLALTATPLPPPTPVTYPAPTNITTNITCLDVCDQVCMQMGVDMKLCYKNCPCQCSAPCLNVCTLNLLGPQCERMCGCSPNSKNKGKSDQAFFLQTPVSASTPATQAAPMAPAIDYEEYLIYNHPTTKCIKTCQNQCIVANPANMTAILGCLNNCSSTCYSMPGMPTIPAMPTVPATISNDVPLPQAAPNLLIADTASTERQFGKMRWMSFFVVFLLISAIITGGITACKKLNQEKSFTGKKSRLIYKNDRPVIYSKLV